jgi:hypothetical protein
MSSLPHPADLTAQVLHLFSFSACFVVMFESTGMAILISKQYYTQVSLLVLFNLSQPGTSNITVALLTFTTYQVYVHSTCH